jgi:hypothetical protein
MVYTSTRHILKIWVPDETAMLSFKLNLNHIVWSVGPLHGPGRHRSHASAGQQGCPEG